MKLVTFGIDDKRNLIVQFLVFVHPHNQQHLTLYQLETVPVPKPYIAFNSDIYLIKNSRIRNM